MTATINTHFDIMHNGIFVKTMHLRVPCTIAFCGGKVERVMDSDALKQEVESRLPTLKGKDYNIVFL